MKADPYEATHYRKSELTGHHLFYKMIDNKWFFHSNGSWHESWEMNKKNPSYEIKEIK